MDNNLANKINTIIAQETLDLNAEVSSKLNQARQKALLGRHKKSFSFTQWLIPATALSAMLIYLLMPLSQEVSDKNTNYAVVEDIQNMEIIEQYELLEDLEFYEWLSHEDETSSI